MRLFGFLRGEGCSVARTCWVFSWVWAALITFCVIHWVWGRSWAARPRHPRSAPGPSPALGLAVGWLRREHRPFEVRAARSLGSTRPIAYAYRSQQKHLRFSELDPGTCPGTILPGLVLQAPRTSNNRQPRLGRSSSSRASGKATLSAMIPTPRTSRTSAVKTHPRCSAQGLLHVLGA